MDAPHIWVPKLKIIEAELVAPRSRTEGFFLLEACNRYGQVRRSLLSRQLITDHGMTQLGAATSPLNNVPQGSSAVCRVGTGSPTFTFASTGLGSPVTGNGSATVGSPTATVDTTGDDGYRVRLATTKEFTLGSIVATLTEVGFFTASSSNTTGAFLDLIRDSGGTATSFPVTADDQLRVTHILDIYPPLGDGTGSFTITGSAGSGSHDYVSRIANLAGLDSGNSRGSLVGVGPGTWSTYAYRDVVDNTELGAITGPIGGVQLQASSSNSAETAADDGTVWSRTCTGTWGLSTANHANGITGFFWQGTSGSAGVTRAMKVRVTPAIPKYAGSIQRILTITMRGSFERA